MKNYICHIPYLSPPYQTFSLVTYILNKDIPVSSEWLAVKIYIDKNVERKIKGILPALIIYYHPTPY